MSRYKLAASIICLASTQIFGITATWNSTATTAVWNENSNWTPTTAPNGEDDAAILGDVIIADTTISLSTGILLNSLQLNPSEGNNYTISGSIIQDLGMTEGTAGFSLIAQEAGANILNIPINARELHVENRSISPLTFNNPITVLENTTISFSGKCAIHSLTSNNISIGSGTLTLNNSISSTSISFPRNGAILQVLTGDLSLTASSSLTIAEGITPLETFNIATGASLSLNCIITDEGGSARLTKTGGGTLTLNRPITSAPVSPYTFYITEGTLSIATALSMPTALALQGGTLQTAVSTNTTAPLNINQNNSAIDTQSFDLSFSGDIFLSRNFSKLGSGSLSLLGTTVITDSPTLTINEGSVIAPPENLPLTIVNNSTLTFRTSTDGAYTGTLSGGDGILTKDGAGTLTLATASITQDQLTIEEGKLVANTTVTIASELNVLPSSYLGGTGPIGGSSLRGQCSIRNEGTIQPGNSIGTLTLVGNYTQATGSSLEIEISPSSADHLIISSGSMTIEPGATLLIIPEAGSYTEGSTYEIITVSDDSLLGSEFQTVQVLPNLFRVGLSYTENSLILSILSSGLDISGGNIGNLVTCLNEANSSSSASEDLSLIMNTLASLPDSTLRASLETMQPSLFTALAIASEESIFRMQKTIEQRLQSFFWECSLSKKDRKIHLWASESFTSSRQLSKKNQPGFHTSTPSSTIGLDASFGSCGILGLSGGYSLDHLTWSNQRGSGFIKNFYESVYGGFKGENLYFISSIMTAWSDYKANRSIQFFDPDLSNRVAHHSNRGFAVDGHLEIGAQIGCLFIARPYVMGDFVFLEEKGFTEQNGGSISLEVEKYRANALKIEIGCDLARSCQVRFGSIEPHIQVGLTVEKRYQGDSLSAHLIDQPCEFSVEGMNPNRIYFSTTLGATGILINELLFFSLDYSGSYGSKYISNEGSGRIQLNF